MAQAVEEGDGFGALFAAADRHVGRFVRREDGDGVLDGFELAAKGFEIGVGHGEAPKVWVGGF